MSADQEILKEIVKHNLGSIISQDYGDAGVATFKNLIEKVTEIYRFLDIEKFEEIIVFSTWSQSSSSNLEFPSESVSIDDFKRFARSTSNKLTVRIKEGAEVEVWENYVPDLKALKDISLVYRYAPNTESFCFNDKDLPLYKISGTSSYFSLTTFKDLRSALEDYKDKRARSSSCRILTAAWFDPKNRIFFNSSPEEIMRDSLEQFLADRLRGNVEIRPEQNIDDSHPVDIKVTWLLTNKLAIIEIKWLGKSIKKLNDSIVEYSESRALQGAKQLATYLDDNRSKVPEQITKGYLVIFDARRKGTNNRTVSISYKDGLHYKDSEIRFNPEYHKIRPYQDFDLPIRMFLEPICNP